MTTWYSNPGARHWVSEMPAPQVGAFHQTLPGYAPTPLVDLPSLAAELGVGRVLVKDESARLGLPAFKVLGASWACSRVLQSGPAVLVTATDGNHGRAVARMAAYLKTTATVFVPAVMLPETAAHITGEGATVIRVDGDYDDAVRAAAEHAGAEPGRALVQDTAWPGYEEVPGWIVEGYDTMLAEVDEQLGRTPDLVAVPVGVGSLAQAVVAHYRRADPGRGGVDRDAARGPARVLTVEPDTAACVITSLATGRPSTVPTGATVMAGLNCGTISSLAWPVLAAGCDAAVVVSDEAALDASADLVALGVSSGPCGAAPLAGVRAALHHPDRRADLELPDDAVVVLLSTEGLPA